jgi:hypothetical protein
LFLTLPPHVEFSSSPHPHTLRLVQHSTPLPLPVVNCIHYLCHSGLFRCRAGCNLPSSCSRYCSWECVWCMVLTSWLCRVTQADLGLGCMGEIWSNFSQGRRSLGLGPGWQRICRLSRVQFYLISVFCFLQRKKKKGRNSQRLLPQ